jgi:hypothetical protein
MFIEMHMGCPIIVHFSFYEGETHLSSFFAMDFKLCPWFMGAKSTNGNASPLYAKTYENFICVLGGNSIKHIFSSTKGKYVSKSEMSIHTCILFFEMPIFILLMIPYHMKK